MNKISKRKIHLNNAICILIYTLIVFVFLKIDIVEERTVMYVSFIALIIVFVYFSEKNEKRFSINKEDLIGGLIRTWSIPLYGLLGAKYILELLAIKSYSMYYIFFFLILAALELIMAFTIDPITEALSKINLNLYMGGLTLILTIANFMSLIFINPITVSMVLIGSTINFIFVGILIEGSSEGRSVLKKSVEKWIVGIVLYFILCIFLVSNFEPFLVEYEFNRITYVPIIVVYSNSVINSGLCFWHLLKKRFVKDIYE